MKTLYQLIVITKDEEILIDKKVTGSSDEEVRFEHVYDVLKGRGLKLNDVTIFCNTIGYFKVKEVKE